MSPIEYDKTPGGANKKQRTRDGVIPEIAKDPGGPAPSPTMRIRMIRDLRCKRGAFRAGEVVILEPETARSWIGFGFAEQDKSLDGPPETKQRK